MDTRRGSCVVLLALTAACDSGPSEDTADSQPVVVAWATPPGGTSPLAVDLTAEVLGGDPPLAFYWALGDGTTSDVQSPSHVYTASAASEFVASVVVTDADGDAATGQTVIPVTLDTALQAWVWATPTRGHGPLVVHFSSFVTGGDPPITYAWDFDDTTGDDHPFPVHAFLDVGSYEVILTATDADGDPSMVGTTIEVIPDDTPVASVGSDPHPAVGPAPLAVELTCNADGGDGPVAFSWDFGDGQVGSLADTLHLYTFAGDFEPRCTVTDADGDSDEASLAVTVLPDSTPQVAIAAAPTAGDSPLEVDFASSVVGGDGTLVYHWDFGDGETVTLEAGALIDGDRPIESPRHTYLPGLHIPRLIVTDGDGDLGTAATQVHVPNRAPVIDVGSSDPRCIPLGPHVIDASESYDLDEQPLSFDWTLLTRPEGSAAILDDPTSATPSFTADEFGWYEAKLVLSDGIVSDTVTLSFEAAGAYPVANVTRTAYEYQSFDPPITAELVLDCATLGASPFAGVPVSWTSTVTTPASLDTTSDEAGEVVYAGGTCGPAGAGTLEMLATPAVGQLFLEINVMCLAGS